MCVLVTIHSIINIPPNMSADIGVTDIYSQLKTFWHFDMTFVLLESFLNVKTLHRNRINKRECLRAPFVPRGASRRPRFGHPTGLSFWTWLNGFRPPASPCSMTSFRTSLEDSGNESSSLLPFTWVDRYLFHDFFL